MTNLGMSAPKIKLEHPWLERNVISKPGNWECKKVPVFQISVFLSVKLTW